jgi:hypothetical protein
VLLYLPLSHICLPLYYSSTTHSPHFHFTYCSASVHISDQNWGKMYVDFQFTTIMGRHCCDETISPSFQHTRPSYLDLGSCYLFTRGTRRHPYTLLFAVSGTMGHAVLHALRNAPPNKPNPPWLQQLQTQWQATKQAFGSFRGSDSGVASTSSSIHDSDRALKLKSSMQSLKAALHETKEALLTVIGLLPHKDRTDLEDTWPKKSFVTSIA